MKATNADAVKSQADKVGWYVAGAFIADEIIGDAEARSVIDHWNEEHPSNDPVLYDYNRESGKDFDAKTMLLVDKLSYSIKPVIGVSGRNYGNGVYLDSTALDEMTDTERENAVKAHISALSGKPFTAFDQNGSPLDILVAHSDKKFKNKKGKRVPVSKHMLSYLQDTKKQEALILVDELIEASRYARSEQAHHAHDWLDDNKKNDWDIWYTYIVDKDNLIWEANLQVANSKFGEKILYDVHPITMEEPVRKPDTSSSVAAGQPGKSVTSTAQANNNTGSTGSQQANSQNSHSLKPDVDPTNPRELLSSALMDVAQNDIERKTLEKYQAEIETLNRMQADLEAKRREIKEMSFAKGKRDTEKLKALRLEAAKLANNVNTKDKQLLRMEASKALENVLAYETRKAVERERERARQKDRRRGRRRVPARRGVRRRPHRARQKHDERP